MKKRYILFVLIVIVCGIRCVCAVSYFPSGIRLYRHKKANKASDSSGITINSNRIVNKTYESKVNNESVSGRAFCTGWKYNVPLSWIDCVKKPWVDNNDVENKRVSASIGQFIYDLRGKDGISERDYFYGEMAINDFLFQKFKDDVNNVRNTLNTSNIKITETYRKKIENYYDNYEKNTSVKIISVKVNNTDITKANATLKKSSNYQLKILVKCSDNNCKNSNVEAKNIKVNGTIISGAVVSENNDGTETITANIPENYVYSALGTTNSVNIILNKKITTYLAQRYGCGEGIYSINYQPVVPNLLVPDNYSVSLNWDGSFLIEDIIESCEQQIKDDPVANAELYTRLLKDSKNYSKLLDINDTSCTSSDNFGKIDCDKTDISYNWVDTVKINGTDYYEYCSASFKFDNIAVNDNWGKLGGKIYKTDNRLVGEAIVTYSCNVPSLYNDNKTSQKREINNFIPKLYMKVGNNEKNIVGKIKKVNSDKDAGKQLCEFENNKVYCNNYVNNIETKNGFGWAFTSTIEYKYPEKMIGFEIPQDAEISNDNKRNNISIIDFDLNGTVFENGNNERNTECKYGVVNGNSDVLYRTIDYHKPFANYSGETRKTGNNWCYSGGYDLELNNSCLFLGDVDDDGDLTTNDVDLIQYLMTLLDNKELENISQELYEKAGIKNIACVDVDQDGLVTVQDATDLQSKIIRLNSGDASSNGDLNYEDISENEDGTDGCEGNNPTVQKYIMQRPNANGKYKTANNVEKSVGPLYSIKLTPSKIKDIRNNNKAQGGYKLYSNSINEFINQYIGAENVQGLCKPSIDGNMDCDVDNVWKKVE